MSPAFFHFWQSITELRALLIALVATAHMGSFLVGFFRAMTDYQFYLSGLICLHDMTKYP